MRLNKLLRFHGLLVIAMCLIAIEVAMADMGTPVVEGITGIAYGHCNPGAEQGRGGVFVARENMYVVGIPYFAHAEPSSAWIVDSATNTTLATTTTKADGVFTLDTPLYLTAGTRFYAMMATTYCGLEQGPIDYIDTHIIANHSVHGLNPYSEYRGDTGNPETTWWYGVTSLVIAPEVAPPCTPSWSCSEYSDCKINPMSHRDCLSVSDANNCGEPFAGDLADYTIQGCPTESKTSKIAYFNNVNQQKAAEQPAGVFGWLNQLILNFRKALGLN